MEKIKVAFFGTPTISTYALHSLLNNNKFEVVVVVTNADKPIGRSQSELQPSEVAKIAEANNLPLIKTNSINQDIEKLKQFQFDYILTCAFGQFLNEEVLKLPKFKAVNIHASLLPEGRGGAPIHWAIIKGKKETGFSMMEMVKEMDAGDFWTQDRIVIEENDTYDTLHDKFCKLIFDLSSERLYQISLRVLPQLKQDANKVTKWLNINKEDTYIDWFKPTDKIYDLIRGLNSKPIARTQINGIDIKITKAKKVNKRFDLDVGTIISITEQGIKVSTKDSVILIEKIILPGKPEREVKEILNGSLPFKVGDQFRNLIDFSTKNN